MAENLTVPFSQCQFVPLGRFYPQGYRTDKWQRKVTVPLGALYPQGYRTDKCERQSTVLLGVFYPQGHRKDYSADYIAVNT